MVIVRENKKLKEANYQSIKPIDVLNFIKANSNKNFYINLGDLGCFMVVRMKIVYLDAGTVRFGTGKSGDAFELAFNAIRTARINNNHIWITTSKNYDVELLVES